MKRLTISDSKQEIRATQQEIRLSRQSHYHHPLHGLLLVAQGLSCGEVARLLGNAPSTVPYRVRRFGAESSDGLRERQPYRRPSRLSPAQVQVVEQAVRTSPAACGIGAGAHSDGEMFSAFMHCRFALKLAVRQSQRFFCRLGFRLRKPRGVLAQADPQGQAASKELHRRTNDHSVDRWAMDEAQFHHYGSRCRMRVPPETKDPAGLHHPARTAVGYCGAVRSRDGRLLTRREHQQFDALRREFLRHLWAPSGRPGRRVVVVIDNAKCAHARLHCRRRQEQGDQFRLALLPPYSPELNPIERVRNLVRRRCVHN